MDLGREMKSPGTEPASPVSEKQPKITYPGFSLNDETADGFLKECPCDLGDEITATVKLRVSSLRKDEYGKSVGFELLSLDDIAETGEEVSDEKPDAEEKTLGYKRPKGKKESPDVSADSLQD